MQKGVVCSFSGNSSSLIFVSGSNARRSQVSDNGEGVLATALVSQPALPSNGIDPESTKDSSSLFSGFFSEASGHLHSSRSFNDLELDNLRLMCHYFTHAWTSMVSDTDGDAKNNHYELWHDIVPDLAMTHPFLLHALLAVSAVHFALTTPTSSISASELASMANLAQHHHTLSLQLMRKALSAPIDAITIQPLFACSACIAMYAFAHSLIPGPRVAVNPLEEFAQALTMLHGMSAIVQSAPGLLEDTPFKVGLLPAPSDPAMPLSPGTEGYLAAVEAARSRMTWLGGQEEAGGIVS